MIADGASSSALALRYAGLKLLPRTPRGECSALDDSTEPYAATASFGEAMQTSCVSRVANEALDDWCSDPDLNAGLTQPLLSALGLNLGAGDSKTVGWVGTFGDSHPEVAADWTAITLTMKGSTSFIANWNAETQECRDVLASIQLRLLTTKVGKLSSPDEKIIGAELILTSQTVTPARCPLGRSCTTVIPVAASTDFVERPNDQRDFVPGSPTIIPKLPRDFFYPFFLE